MRAAVWAVLACGLAGAQTLVNPLMNSGPDPWVIYRGGFYYFMHTTGKDLRIWKTRRIEDMVHAEEKTVWTPPETGPYSKGIWAPELHYLRGKWYIYFAADAGTNATHRIWVLENGAADPLAGEWKMKGKVADAGDHWAIDPTILEDRGRIYMVWSGWEGAVNGAQNLYIAELANPWTIKGPRVKISTPEYPWEKVGDLTARRDPEESPGVNMPDPPHLDVNEGPEVLRHGDRIFVIYSASACWTDYYSLGMLEAREGSDLLDAASWKKSPMPLFWESAKAGAFGPGHGAFFQSPDGKEDWMLYHANPQPHQGCGGRRSPRVQPFGWKAGGTPDFRRPVGIGVPMAAPSGEGQN